MSYVRRGKRIADLISDQGDYLVVELADQRRARWRKTRPMTLIEFGSLNPRNANFVPGGKVIARLDAQGAR